MLAWSSRSVEMTVGEGAEFIVIKWEVAFSECASEVVGRFAEVSLGGVDVMTLTVG